MQQRPPPGGPLLGGRYRLGAILGSGGMAQVYDAYDERLDRRVAVKVLRPEAGTTGAMRARFEREARAAAGLNHPNVVAVYDTGEERGRAFLVMERLPGESLADRIAAGPMDAGTVSRVAMDVLAALAAAHRVGLVHRDIKPGNVLVSEDGRFQVADFGIAKALNPGGDGEDRSEADLTVTGVVLGTPAYLAPEQVEGHPATAQSDMWALGVVLYEALAGRKPFTGDSPIAIAYAARHARAPDIATLRQDVPPGLARVIRRALTPEPGGRYESAGAMAADLGSPRPGEPVTTMIDTVAGEAAIATTAVAPTRITRTEPPGARALPPTDTDVMPAARPAETGDGGRGPGRGGLFWGVIGGIIAAILIAGGVVAALAATQGPSPSHHPRGPAHHKATTTSTSTSVPTTTAPPTPTSSTTTPASTTTTTTPASTTTTTTPSSSPSTTAPPPSSSKPGKSGKPGKGNGRHGHGHGADHHG